MNLKIVYLLGLVILCDGLRDDSPNNLYANTLRIRGQSGFAVNWNKVKNSDEADPILGYKVSIWGEQLGYAYELKEDGKLEPKTAEDVPSIVWQGNPNVMFQLEPNGKFVAKQKRGLFQRARQGMIKAVYKFKPDGTLEPITANDIPVNT